MGTLFPKALYFKNTFCGCLFMFTENWNKTGEMTAKIFFLILIIMTVCILSVSFNFFPMVQS